MKTARIFILFSLLAVGIYLIIVILFQPFDPKPTYSHLIFRQPQQTLSSSPKSETITMLKPLPYPPENLSMVATAVFLEGELDSSYGLVFASGDGSLIKIGLSPTGQVTLQNGDTAMLPWQPWPHINQANNPNELWVDIQEGQMTIRLNRELLWQGNIPATVYQPSLFAESFGQSASFTFAEIEVFSAAPTQK